MSRRLYPTEDRMRLREVRPEHIAAGLQRLSSLILGGEVAWRCVFADRDEVWHYDCGYSAVP